MRQPFLRNRRLHVLPADASAAGVLPAAPLVAVILTLIETTLRRHRERS